METDDSTPSGGRVLGSVRRLLISATEFLATKLDLIGVELQEEKRRMLEMLVVAGLAFALGLLGLTVLTFSVVFYLCGTYNHAVIGCLAGLSLVYFVLAGVLWGVLQRKAAMSSRLFETTIEELKRDVDWIRKHLS